MIGGNIHDPFRIEERNGQVCFIQVANRCPGCGGWMKRGIGLEGNVTKHWEWCPECYLVKRLGESVTTVSDAADGFIRSWLVAPSPVELEGEWDESASAVLDWLDKIIAEEEDGRDDE